jgi:hypothetical protein
LKDISLHILDIVQNSTAAAATRIRTVICADRKNGMLEITIEDNGCGMDEELLTRVTDPFSTTRTTRKVGLGIPLFKASAEQAGGSFRITSQKGVGTVVKSSYQMDNIDRPPLGDVAGVITDLSAAYPAIDFELSLECGDWKFTFSSREVRQSLGEVPISEFRVVRWLREYIGEGILEIFGGVLSEIVSGTRSNPE